ncbi:hypothetical protein GCM10011309_23370 [Litorimonas cladophorae]|uniref:Uncharacterized protein n=1 Tax=Litorimonas cladophorae TaxID=1220491 RepID=A0A918KQU8_9PROT|nr:hypothetical protein [Litorimonas cladophorae]GGX72364.1 hypothetical protein GCM10011309_23370 [Litorimonas cladophorae]
MQPLEQLYNEIDERKTVRVHSYEVSYRELVQRAVSGESVALRAVAHCLYWGNGGLRNRELAKSILRKLLIEKSDIYAEYLLAHYSILHDDRNTGLKVLRKLAAENFLPAVSLNAHLILKDNPDEETFALTKNKLIESAESGHLKSWILLVEASPRKSFPTRLFRGIYYTIKLFKSGVFKKRDLSAAERAFIFD